MLPLNSQTASLVVLLIGYISTFISYTRTTSLLFLVCMIAAAMIVIILHTHKNIQSIPKCYASLAGINPSDRLSRNAAGAVSFK